MKSNYSAIQISLRCVWKRKWPAALTSAESIGHCGPHAGGFGCPQLYAPVARNLIFTVVQSRKDFDGQDGPRSAAPDNRVSLQRRGRAYPSRMGRSSDICTILPILGFRLDDHEQNWRSFRVWPAVESRDSIKKLCTCPATTVASNFTCRPSTYGTLLHVTFSTLKIN